MPVPLLCSAYAGEEELLPGGQFEVVPGVPTVDDGLCGNAAHTVDHGRAQYEVAEIVGLLREHLVEEIVDDGSVTESRLGQQRLLSEPARDVKSSELQQR